MKARVIYLKYKTDHIITVINNFQCLSNTLRINSTLCYQDFLDLQDFVPYPLDCWPLINFPKPSWMSLCNIWFIHHIWILLVSCSRHYCGHQLLVGPDWIHTATTWQQLPLCPTGGLIPPTPWLFYWCWSVKKQDSFPKACTFQKFRESYCMVQTLDQLARIAGG